MSPLSLEKRALHQAKAGFFTTRRTPHAGYLLGIIALGLGFHIFPCITLRTRIVPGSAVLSSSDGLTALQLVLQLRMACLLFLHPQTRCWGIDASLLHPIALLTDAVLHQSLTTEQAALYSPTVRGRRGRVRELISHFIFKISLFLFIIHIMHFSLFLPHFPLFHSPLLTENPSPNITLTLHVLCVWPAEFNV